MRVSFFMGKHYACRVRIITAPSRAAAAGRWPGRRIPEGRGNSFSVLRRGQEHGFSVRICQTSPPVRHPLSCPGRAVKRCLRSLTVLVSSKNTLFQQQTGAHEISTITDHDLFARARRKAQYDRAAALFHYPVHHDRRLQRHLPLAHGI